MDDLTHGCAGPDLATSSGEGRKETVEPLRVTRKAYGTAVVPITIGLKLIDGSQIFSLYTWNTAEWCPRTGAQIWNVFPAFLLLEVCGPPSRISACGDASEQGALVIK